MFSKKELRALLIPLIIEQVLTGLMGVADTLMVSSVGEAAISGVSLVDSINMLAVYFFSALAAGGTIVVAQYIGREDGAKAKRAARQVMLAAGALSVLLCGVLAVLRMPLLRLIFGHVEEAVLRAADVYMLITVLSYPFLALYTASAALFRATGDSRKPMVVAAVADVLNIAGNALLIFGCGMGVAGAALATLASRMFSAGMMLRYQQRPGSAIAPGRFRDLRPDIPMIKRILRIGLPSAVENGMFQLGRLLVQSTVTVLGTTAIAAQAVVYTLETCSSMPAMAIGTGLLTVAGQCMGRGRVDEARRYTRLFVGYARLILLGVNIVLSAAVPFITGFTALSPDGALLVCRLTWFTCVLKVLIWPGSFTRPCTLRAAGDVGYAMWVSTLSMWICRVGLSWVLCRYTPVGLWGVWIAWCTDWLARNIAFGLRFRSRKWERKHVLE